MRTFKNRLVVTLGVMVSLLFLSLANSAGVQAAPNAECSWEPRGSSEFTETLYVTAQYSGSAPAGTIEVGNCDTQPPSKAGMVAVSAQFAELQYDCLPDEWAPTGPYGGTNFNSHVAQCRPAGSSFFMDDSGILNVGGHVYCMGRNNSACPVDGQDYNADLTNFMPRSIGYRRQVTDGTNIPLNGSGGFGVSYEIKQQYDGGFYFVVAIRFNYEYAPISCALTASPSTINSGSASTLTWTTMGGPTSAVINQSIGSVSSSGGSRSVSPTSTTTYTMTVSKSGVPNATCSTTVTVNPSAACASYSPYSPFSPMIRDVALPASGAPPASESSAWNTSGPTYGTWSTSGWSLVSSSTTSQTEQQFRSRTITTTQRQYYYYYPYVYNSDGTLMTSVSSVQGNSYWPGENTPYTGGNNGTVRLDYNTHYNNYPYDQHQPVVNYRVRYDQRRVTRERTITTTETQRRTRSRTRTSSTATWGSWSYSSWSAWSSSTNTGGWSNVSGTDTSNGGQTWTSNRTVDAPFMPPCFPRRYSMSAAAIEARLDDDREMPHHARFSGSITANFTVDNHGLDPMRQASRINNMGYTVTYRIRRANGTMTAATNVAPSPASPRNFVASNNNRFSSSGPTTVTAEIGVSVPAPLQVGDSVCWRISLTGPTQGQVGISGTALAGASGTFSTPEMCSPTVVNWPYVKVLGNDVVAGGVVGGCSSGAIRTHFRSGAGNARGSSAQHAAFAGQAIQGFISAALTNSAGATGNGFVPGPLRGLSFGNSTANYGGNYAANDGTLCMPDYFASRPTSTEALTSANLNAEIHTPNGDSDRLEFYYVNSSATLNAVNVGNRTRKVFFIDGTLTLNGNVTMNGTWNNRDDIPFVTFIARNITINGGVSSIDGFYVADDTISTCHMANFANCRTPLTVNGALSALNVQFLRTRGSHRDSKELEGRPTTLTVPNTCSDGTSSTPLSPGVTGIEGRSCAAEIVNFAPELYLALSDVGAPPEDIRYDSFIVLPPNL